MLMIINKIVLFNFTTNNSCVVILSLGRICQNRGSNTDISMGKLQIMFNTYIDED